MQTNLNSKFLLKTTRRKICPKLAHVSRTKPYYDRKTILLDLDQVSGSSESSDKDFAAVGRTLPSKPESTTPAKPTSNVHRTAMLQPGTVATPSFNPTPEKTPQQTLETPSAYPNCITETIARNFGSRYTYARH